MHSESADSNQLFSFPLDTLALERDFGVLPHIEKVGGPQMVITCCNSSIDARGLDSDID